MAKFQEDDCLLVGREGVDYKVSYKDFSDQLSGDDVDLSPYAKLEDPSQSITAKEFIGDGSKLTNLPSGDVGISEVLAEDNTAEPLQAMRFRIGATLPPDPDNLNPDPILLETGVGSAHRALASSWTGHIEGVGGKHSDANARYFANYMLDANAEPLAIARVSASDGFYFYKSADINGPGVVGVVIDPSGMHINGAFRVDLEGSVEARKLKIEKYTYDSSAGGNVLTHSLKYEEDGLEVYGKNISVTNGSFVGDGSKLTGVALPDFRTLTPLT